MEGKREGKRERGRALPTNKIKPHINKIKLYINKIQFYINKIQLYINKIKPHVNKIKLPTHKIQYDKGLKQHYIGSFQQIKGWGLHYVSIFFLSGMFNN